MNVNLKGRSAIVTGGGTGIGRAISIGLARNGAAVAINYSKSRKEAEATADEIIAGGGRAIAAQADVTKEDQVEGLVEGTIAEFGGLDILVANAGGRPVDAPSTDLPRDQWSQGFDVNCTSAFLCVRAAAARLPDHTGRIVLTSSISARSGAGPGMVVYAAAKGALNNMTRNWANEFAPRGITVNAIAPGIIRTRLHEQFTAPDEYQRLIERIPLGRDGLPEDCVGSVLLFVSEAGSFITGQILEINGGMAMP